MEKPGIIKKIIYLSLLSFFAVSCTNKISKTVSPDSIVIYPEPPAETKIQYLTSFSTSADFEGEQTVFNRFVFGEKDPLPIVKPYGINVEKNKIYICDTGIKGLEILNITEKTFEYFIPGGQGKLQLPINSHVDEEGNLYIADGNRRQVVIFDKDLKYKYALTLKGDAKPTDVFTDDENIWIAAIDNHEIQVFHKSDYSFVGSFPKKNTTGEGYLYQPANIFVDDSSVYISDIGACKIVQYDKNMDFQNSFGSSGMGYGQFTRPKGICADKDGNTYIVDAAFENIQIFNKHGRLLMSFGGTYSGPGGMWLPADVTIDYTNLDHYIPFVDKSYHLEYLIFVSNQYGPDKISVYGFVTELKNM